MKGGGFFIVSSEGVGWRGVGMALWKGSEHSRFEPGLLKAQAGPSFLPLRVPIWRSPRGRLGTTLYTQGLEVSKLV